MKIPKRNVRNENSGTLGKLKNRKREINEQKVKNSEVEGIATMAQASASDKEFVGSSFPCVSTSIQMLLSVFIKID